MAKRVGADFLPEIEHVYGIRWSVAEDLVTPHAANWDLSTFLAGKLLRHIQPVRNAQEWLDRARTDQVVFGWREMIALYRQRDGEAVRQWWKSVGAPQFCHIAAIGTVLRDGTGLRYVPALYPRYGEGLTISKVQLDERVDGQVRPMTMPYAPRHLTVDVGS